MTIDNFCFYLQNRLFQTSQTGGQEYHEGGAPLVFVDTTYNNPALKYRAMLRRPTWQKRSSLFGQLVDEEKKVVAASAPVANVIKIFTAVSYDFSLKARAFVPGKPFQTSLIFVGKARAYPSEAPLRCSTQG
jgi:hypothetical protein